MTKPVVVIVDTGGANLASLIYAFDRIGAQAKVSSDPDTIREASHVVLPGVGAAGDAMRRLHNDHLATVVCELTQPVLGICLGMHLLAAHSPEQDVDCLNIVDIHVTTLTATRERSVPHMGWNSLARTSDSILLRDLPDEPWFYFVHSYALAQNSYSKASYTYGDDYCAVLEHQNFFATQFHPERSAGAGQQVLRNFLEHG